MLFLFSLIICNTSAIVTCFLNFRQLHLIHTCPPNDNHIDQGFIHTSYGYWGLPAPVWSVVCRTESQLRLVCRHPRSWKLLLHKYSWFSAFPVRQCTTNSAQPPRWVATFFQQPQNLDGFIPYYRYKATPILTMHSLIHMQTCVYLPQLHNFVTYLSFLTACKKAFAVRTPSEPSRGSLQRSPDSLAGGKGACYPSPRTTPRCNWPTLMT